jgi:hypothetical protein
VVVVLLLQQRMVQALAMRQLRVQALGKSHLVLTQRSRLQQQHQQPARSSSPAQKVVTHQSSRRQQQQWRHRQRL